jgi:outer membrane lipoprotein SlyB
MRLTTAKQGETAMQKHKACTIINFSLAALFTLSVGCTQPLSKREQGGLVGGGIGAASGAIIGSTVGHAGAGALIGGPIGLLAGALIGDQLMAQDQRQDLQQREIARNQAEIARLRREIERLQRETDRLRDR